MTGIDASGRCMMRTGFTWVFAARLPLRLTIGIVMVCVMMTVLRICGACVMRIMRARRMSRACWASMRSAGVLLIRGFRNIRRGGNDGLHGGRLFE